MECENTDGQRPSVFGTETSLSSICTLDLCAYIHVRMSSIMVSSMSKYLKFCWRIGEQLELEKQNDLKNGEKCMLDIADK